MAAGAGRAATGPANLPGQRGGDLLTSISSRAPIAGPVEALGREVEYTLHSTHCDYSRHSWDPTVHSLAES